MALEFVSEAGQWIVLTLLTIATLTLARQVGLLHLRVPPPPPKELAQGIQVGERIPSTSGRDVSGDPIPIVSSDRRALLVFVTPTCSTCEALLPSLRSISKSERSRMKVVLASIADQSATRRYMAAHKLVLPSDCWSGLA